MAPRVGLSRALPLFQAVVPKQIDGLLKRVGWGVARGNAAKLHVNLSRYFANAVGRRGTREPAQEAAGKIPLAVSGVGEVHA